MSEVQDFLNRIDEELLEVESNANDGIEDEGESQMDSQLKEKKRKRKPCKKVEAKWAVADETKLIREVENHVCLYDVTSTDNKDKFKREAAWRTVAEAFGKEDFEAECQAKWNSIRGTYRRLSNAHLPSGSGAPSKSKWVHYADMAFVGNVRQSYSMQSESNLPV